MITDILNSYSFGELSALVGNGIIEEYERLFGKKIEKKDLVKAVYSEFSFDLVAQKEQREKLIERMRPEQVDKLINDYISEYRSEISINEDLDKYNLLISLSNKWPEKFIDILGFKDALAHKQSLLSGVKGIQNLNASYPMYPYQQKMVKKVNLLIENKKEKRCLLHLPTGAGKTRTAMNIAIEHLRTNNEGLVLWLADTSELCAQATKEFSEAWKNLGNRELKLYSYYSNTNISLGGVEDGFLVAGLQKLNSASGSNDYKILYEQLRKHVTMIIFDEAHKSIAPTYSKIINDMISSNNQTFLIGLSATPGRKLENNSDEDGKLIEFFHGNKVTMRVAGYESPIKYLVEHEYLAQANFINIDYNGSKITFANEFSNQKRSREIREALSEDDNRNLKLIDVIRLEHIAGKSIIVFACSVEHSRKLASILAFSGIKAYSLDSKYDDNETRKYKVSDYLKGNVKVLVNFNILTAGFDAPNTSVVVIARPTDSLVQYSQMAGRAMRGKRSGGNKECNIYTVRDDIPAFTSVVQAFKHWDKLWNEA